MSDWKITKDEKKKLSVMVSSETFDIIESMKSFILEESKCDKISDSQAIEVITKIASKNADYKAYIKSKNLS